MSKSGRAGYRSVVVLAFFTGSLSAAAAKGTEILWDRFGVAHVYAKSVEDLFYGYGSPRATAIFCFTYMANREAAPLSISGLLISKTISGSGRSPVPQRSAKWLEMQSPRFRSYLEAFAKGINDYAAKHPEALSEESKRVLPVTALDPDRAYSPDRALHVSRSSPACFPCSAGDRGESAGNSGSCRIERLGYCPTAHGRRSIRCCSATRTLRGAVGRLTTRFS